MRVAYITRAPFISGAERALQLILEHAASVDIDPLVICPHQSPFLAWCQQHGVCHEAIELAERDKFHPLRWFSSVARMRRALRSHRIDIVHSNQVWAYAAAGTAAGLLGIPRVCHMRDEVSETAVRWWCRSGVEAVVCISEHIEKLMSPAWDGQANRPIVKTMRDPVPVLAAPRGNEVGARCAARQKFGVASETVAFGFIGQIVEVKGLMELLRAVAAIVSDERWTLLVAGRDPNPGQPYENACRQWVRDNGLAGRVTFLGFLDDVADFYRAIDVAVVSSLKEPLGLIPLEAAAARKPAIAFASGGLKESIVDGQTGWLLRTGDVEGLCARLKRVVEDPSTLESMGQSAREWVVNYCDPQEHARVLTHLYEDLLAAPAGASRGRPA